VVCSCSARDQHGPGFSLPSLVRVGHHLLLRSRKVTIWTPKGRSTQGGFPEAPMAVFPGVFCLYLIVYSYLWSQYTIW
jgi:hypothetical protein